MKKYCRIFSVVLIALIALCSLSVFAAQPLANDEAGLMTEEACARVEAALLEVTDRYDFDCVLYTTDDAVGDISEFCKDYYESAGFREDGCVLVISMYERDWWMRGFGKGNIVISDSAFYEFSEEMLPYLSYGYYEEAFTKYAVFLDKVLSYYAEHGTAYECGKHEGTSGFEYDVDDPHGYDEPQQRDLKSFFSKPVNYILSLLGGGLFGLIPVSGMKSKMKSVRSQTAAGTYVKDGSFDLRTCEDVFLYSNVTRIARPQDTDRGSSGGGGGHISSHTSSGGFSHGGGGGKF